MNIFKVLVAFTALAVTLQFSFVAGTNYTVGAPGGSWDLTTNYTKWVSNIAFHPGDNLIFSYTALHDVWEVNDNDYKTCSKGSSIKEYSGGNTVIALTEAGSRYFICSIGDHCNGGMKLQVSVVSNVDPNSPPSPPSQVVSPPPPPKDAAAANSIGTHLAIALVLGELLMFFV